jgi:hypothetical protein
MNGTYQGEVVARDSPEATNFLKRAPGSPTLIYEWEKMCNKQ